MTIGRSKPVPDAGTSGRRLVLVLDSATTRLVAALAEAATAPGAAADGRLLAVRAEPSGYRHGELLLPLVERLLEGAGRSKADIGGVVVGTGPGAFTGLRVGLATAAGIARALRCPLAGVPTSEAIIAAAAEDAGCPISDVVLLLPAGPNDRIVARAGRPAVLLPAGREPELDDGAILVAVDLPGRAPEAALERGVRATAPERLATILFRLGRAGLGARPSTRDGHPFVPEPEYVTLPRGLAAVRGEVRLVRA
ncbi:MAG TPA: tRNA (adenosine(37)-N6)-threonylcarbamoyltransferase complex dimerization subunit type 1 TsaB [Candidatus Binatia bacterium]|nr:tRNA (adenosine(37)-N6)-threonylcarbamoyltransferase complex dimerization subunit type 1 TsaB [Candidatus Binatia bacterium]